MFHILFLLCYHICSQRTEILVRANLKPISCHSSLLIPPENIRKRLVFLCFQAVSKEIIRMKWVKESAFMNNKSRKYFGLDLMEQKKSGANCNGELCLLVYLLFIFALFLVKCITNINFKININIKIR